MSPGAACGDPRAAPGYLDARRRAPEEAPGCRGNRALVVFLAPPEFENLYTDGYGLQNLQTGGYGLSAWQA